MPNVQENCRRENKGNVSENEEKCIEERSGAYECRAAAAENRSSLPKVQGKRKRNEIKGGKREAVRVGWKVIRSRLSCAGGRVEREGESGGGRRDEMTKEKGASNAWPTGAPTRQFPFRSEREYEAILTQPSTTLYILTTYLYSDASLSHLNRSLGNFTNRLVLYCFFYTSLASSTKR